MLTFTFMSYTLQVGGCASCIWDFHSLFYIEALLPSLLFPPLLDFQHPLALFDSTFIGNFRKLLKPCSLECSEVPLLHQQTSLPISKCGIGLVFVEVIASAMYLGSWGLVTLIITSKFLQNNRLFLLGAISGNNSNPFPFQASL